MEEKEVKDMFNAISLRYDLANILISLGLEKYWRNRFERHIDRDAKKILDACCGTGISTLRIRQKTGPESTVCGVDFSSRMLDVARQRARKKKARGVFFEMGDICRMPFADASFDLACMIFGIRNIPHKTQALQELYRVIKPGGKVLIMEFSFPRSQPLKRLYGFYLDKVLVNLGAALTADRSAYAHLAGSIRSFPKAGDFARIIEEAGWSRIRHHHHTFDTCIIYEASKD